MKVYSIITENPYEFTSDEIFLKVFAEKHDLLPQEIPEAKTIFFSKGQPCLGLLVQQNLWL
jgi:hypothetical protein